MSGGLFLATQLIFHKAPFGWSKEEKDDKGPVGPSTFRDFDIFITKRYWEIFSGHIYFRNITLQVFNIIGVIQHYQMHSQAVEMRLQTSLDCV